MVQGTTALAKLDYYRDLFLMRWKARNEGVPTKQELYLPAQLATLTGLDEDWRTDREFAQDLWRGLRYEPDEHWKMQARLTDSLSSSGEGGNPLQEWGIE